MPAEPGEPLSEREIEIVELVADGLTNREIAVRTYLSPNTVKVHLRNIFTKTGVSSRTELTVLAMQEGWITVPGITDAQDSAGPNASAEEEAQVEPGSPTLPPWPRTRWAALAAGLIMALVALALPRQPAGQAATPIASGLVDQSTAGPVVDAPASGENGGARWDELAPLPVRRARMGVVALDNSIYVVGGSAEDGPTGRLDIYDINTTLWRSGAVRPAALANVGVVAVPDERLVLASASPRRRKLLAELGLRFDVCPCPLSEPECKPTGVTPGAWAEALAYFKGSAVAEQYRERWVLGADTIVVCAGELLGKPVDVRDARRMLELQAGRATEVITGVCLVRRAEQVRRIIGHAVTLVWMRDAATERGAYLASGDWRGKAGAYGIQNVGDRLVERLEGSHSNVVGLPLSLVERMLHVANLLPARHPLR